MTDINTLRTVVIASDPYKTLYLLYNTVVIGKDVYAILINRENGLYSKQPIEKIMDVSPERGGM